MTAPDLSALIRSQPWGIVNLQYDGWYQYAVCEKASGIVPTATPEKPSAGLATV
jgi:hypothetical protein